jgi:hypothetical protein
MAVKTQRKKQMAVASESIVNNEPRTFTDADFPVGTTAHQGDLILVRIESLPSSAKKRANRQLADGNTQGSRHILAPGCKVFDCDGNEIVASIAAVCRGVTLDAKYVGPVFQTVKGKADLDHPEHGNHLYRGDMTIACVYQRNLDAENREQRVVD